MSNIEFTDEQFLHQYFHFYLKHMYGDELLPPKYWFMDGFQEPLDPDYLSDSVLCLATRLGYKLKDGMWVETSSVKTKEPQFVTVYGLYSINRRAGKGYSWFHATRLLAKNDKGTPKGHDWDNYIIEQTYEAAEENYSGYGDDK